MVPRIELVPRRQEDLQGGNPDYHIDAGALRVGRIYRTHFHSASEGWRYGVNGVMVDFTVGVPLQGYAASFEDAKSKLREAFDIYLAWALALPQSDLKFPRVDRDLKAMGAR